MRGYDLWAGTREKAEVEPKSGLRILRTETSAGTPSVKIWKPKAKNPFANYYFKTVDERESYIERQIASQLRHYEYISEQKRQRTVTPEQAEAMKKLAVVGKMFYTSWGYDQTNYDYIVIVKASKTGKTVLCRRTSSLHMGEDGTSNVQEPVFCPFGDTFQMQIVPDKEDGFTLKGSYPYCYDGTGSRRCGYFLPVSVGQQFRETMAGFGH